MLGEEPLGVMEVAQMLHVGRNKVYELARTGELSSYHIGRKLRFTVRDVQRYLDDQHRVSVREGSEGSFAHAFEGDVEDGGPTYLNGILAERADFVVAGLDPVTGLLAGSLRDAGVQVSHRSMNGYAALVGIYLGEVDATVVDLYDAKSNNCNVAFAQSLAPGVSLSVMVLAERMWGFAVAPGNPKKISTWGSVLREGVRVAQQQPGSSGRILLDEKLLGMEARSEAVTGYSDEPTGEHDAVVRVLRGECDVAVCTESTAMQVGGVSFVPLHKGRLDVVMRKGRAMRPFVRAVQQLASSEAYAAEVEAVTCGTCAKMGAVVFEC